jgi:hypothetical protein
MTAAQSCHQRTRYLRCWSARLSSLLVFCTLLAFIFGEGFNPLRLESRQLVLSLFFPLGVGLGLLIAWRWEALGSWVTLGCLVAFYGLCHVLVGKIPSGWWFAVFALPSLLFLASRRVRRRARSRPPETRGPKIEKQ